VLRGHLEKCNERRDKKIVTEISVLVIIEERSIMGNWSAVEKTVLGMIFYVCGFIVVIAGAALLCFRKEIFNSTGLVIPTPVPIIVIVLGCMGTIIGDILRRASRKKE
jgi:hypothetical protein